MYLNINKYAPLHRSSYVKLSDELSNSMKGLKNYLKQVTNASDGVI